VSGSPDVAQIDSDEALVWPVLVRVLGPFRLVKRDQPVAVRSGGKTEALLCRLALESSNGVPRETLLEALWPDAEPELAAQSLSSLVYSLHRQLGDALGGAAPVTHEQGAYRLNQEAGVGVDLACFDLLVGAGDRELEHERPELAATLYRRAVGLYGGDLCLAREVRAVVERERLRARYMTVLGWLADHHCAAGDYGAALEFALKLLASDPCREDAHRLVMRCHVRRGERAQALHQYRVCKQILSTEYDAAPEPATTALYDRIRLAPDTV
jgi:DNA-binding SARP family transcriptional activator